MFARLVHDFFYVSSLALNALLISLITITTPTYLLRYSLVLLYMAVVEISTAVSGLLIFKRTLTTPSFYISVIGGICHNWYPSLCQSINAIHLAGVAHYAVMIGFCSCYRYWVIAVAHDEPKRRNVILALLTIHLPTIAIFTNFANLPTVTEGPAFERAMNESQAVYNLEPQLRENNLLIAVNRDFSSNLAAFWILSLIVPVLLGVFTSSVRINNILASHDHMSNHSKERHAQILKGLIYQSLLPSLYGIAVIAFRAAGNKMIDSEDFGYLTPMIVSLITALSPLFTMIFTVPYRNALRRIISKRSGALDSSITIQSPILTKEGLNYCNNQKHVDFFSVDSLVINDVKRLSAKIRQ